MSALNRTTPFLMAALLVAGGLACRKPAPAAQPEQPKAAPAPAPAPAMSDAVKPDDTQKRLAEQAAEAARKAEAAYQQAAMAALQDVHFAFDKADIAAFMKQYPKANVFIDGNCDERGTVEYNLALGERRAHSAMAYLVGLGVPAGRLTTTSYGKEKPVCMESVESCWVRNRRAHFSLLK